MTAWWQSLVPESQIFYAIGIVSLIALLFQMLLTLLGFGGAHDADIGAHHDHESGSWLINVRTVMAFMSGFGWAGDILMNRGYSLGELQRQAANTNGDGSKAAAKTVEANGAGTRSNANA